MKFARPCGTNNGPRGVSAELVLPGSGEGNAVKRAVRRIAMTTMVVMALVSVPMTAMAGNFGSAGDPGTAWPNNGVWFTPDRTFAIGKVNLTVGWTNQVNDALAEEYNPTDLVVTSTVVSSCTGSSGWDLCIFDDNYGDNNVYGWNSCAGFVNGVDPNQTCTMSWVRMNLFYTTTGDMKRVLACHEIGHSVGLRHPDEGTNLTSCMHYDFDNFHLSAHDKAHINGKY